MGTFTLRLPTPPYSRPLRWRYAAVVAIDGWQEPEGIIRIHLICSASFLWMSWLPRNVRHAALNLLTGLTDVIWCGQAPGQDQTAQGREGIVRLPGTTGFPSDSGHERCCGADRRLVGRFDIHHLSLQGVHGQMGSHEGGQARRQRQHLPVPLHCPAADDV